MKINYYIIIPLLILIVILLITLTESDYPIADVHPLIESTTTATISQTTINKN